MAEFPTTSTIRIGQQGKNVKAVQHLLIYRGYSISADGIFGGNTQNAIASFQASRGLIQTGEANQDTIYWLIDTVASRTINQAAYAAQTLLSKFESLLVDGDFYTGSQTATINFQTRMGLGVTGAVDEYTWLFLFGYDSYPDAGGGSTSTGETYAVCGSSAYLLTDSQKYSNAKFIYSFLTSNFEFTKDAACAVLGNMEDESGINPATWQGGYLNNTSGGYGLVQWTPATKFLNWAKEYDVLNEATPAAVNSLASSNPSVLMDTELRYLVWGCMFDGHFVIGAINSTGYTMTFDQFRHNTYSLSPETLAMVFFDHFEKGTPHREKREGYARKWFDAATNDNW